MELLIKAFDELSTQELYEILRLRDAVFIVEQNCPYQDIDGLDRDAWHVFLRDGEGIQAYLRLLPPGAVFEECALGRVIARKRRCGLGTQIVSAGIAAARERLDAAAIRIEAQVYAKGLYEKLGFVSVSEPFLEDGIPHIQMLLKL